MKAIVTTRGAPGIPHARELEARLLADLPTMDRGPRLRSDALDATLMNTYGIEMIAAHRRGRGPAPMTADRIAGAPALGGGTLFRLGTNRSPRRHAVGGAQSTTISAWLTRLREGATSRIYEISP